MRFLHKNCESIFRLFFSAFSPECCGLRTGALRGVIPPGKHGWHVHEFPIRDRAVGCGSVGGHFNPFGVTHGSPDGGILERHVGDLGNLVSSGSNGQVFIQFSDHIISLFGPRETSIRGRTLVIHAGEDDLGTGVGDARAGSLATGNAGARLGCCEIL